MGLLASLVADSLTPAPRYPSFPSPSICGWSLVVLELPQLERDSGQVDLKTRDVEEDGGWMDSVDFTPSW